MAWAKNGTPHTLGSAADDLVISDLTSTKFNMIMIHIPYAANYNQPSTRMGNGSLDSGTNYTERHSFNGAADGTGVNQTQIQHWPNPILPDDDIFFIDYIINISTEEKLSIGFGVDSGAVGAGTAPNREESVGKWANTSNQYDQISMYNAGGTSNSFAISSNLSALGTD